MLICQDTRITCFNSASGFECVDRCNCWSWDQLLTYKCQECQSAIVVWVHSNLLAFVRSLQTCVDLSQFSKMLFNIAVPSTTVLAKQYLFMSSEASYLACPGFALLSACYFVIFLSVLPQLNAVILLIAMIAYFLYSSQYVCYCHLSCHCLLT